MTVRTQTCYIVSCDGCETEETGAEYTIHYESAEDAIEYAVACADWVLSDDSSKVYCPDCSHLAFNVESPAMGAPPAAATAAPTDGGP